MNRTLLCLSLVSALSSVAPLAAAREPQPNVAPAASSGPNRAGASARHAIVALRQAAEGVVGPQIAPHDRAAIASQRLADLIAALAELPTASQTAAVAKLRAGSALSKGLAQGLSAYRSARQHAAGDPGKLSRSQSALKLGVAKLVVEGNGQFAELADKNKEAKPEDPEPVLKRADALKPERWTALKKDLVAVADRLDTL